MYLDVYVQITTKMVYVIYNFVCKIIVNLCTNMSSCFLVKCAATKWDIAKKSYLCKSILYFKYMIQKIIFNI